MCMPIDYKQNIKFSTLIVLKQVNNIDYFYDFLFLFKDAAF